MNNEQDMKDQQQAHALYQSLPRDMPPPELDARILQAAHQAVHEPAQRVVKLHHKKSKSVWLKPLSYAAVMVLSLGVVLHMQTEIPMTIQSHPEMFHPDNESDEAIEVYPVKELQQADHAAPATQALQQKSAPAPEMSKKAARSLATEPVVEPKNKVSKSNDATQGMQPAASLMMDAASHEEPPAAAAVLSERAYLKRESELPDTAVAEMLQLYHAGETQQLILQLRIFIVKYPQFKLPKELQSFAVTNGLLKSATEKSGAE